MGAEEKEKGGLNNEVILVLWLPRTWLPSSALHSVEEELENVHFLASSPTGAFLPSRPTVFPVTYWTSAWTALLKISHARKRDDLFNSRVRKCLSYE